MLRPDPSAPHLKRRGFTFEGTTFCYAFMQAVEMVNDQEKECFRYQEIDSWRPSGDRRFLKGHDEVRMEFDNTGK